MTGTIASLPSLFTRENCEQIRRPFGMKTNFIFEVVIFDNHRPLCIIVLSFESGRAGQRLICVVLFVIGLFLNPEEYDTKIWNLGMFMSFVHKVTVW